MGNGGVPRGSLEALVHHLYLILNREQTGLLILNLKPLLHRLFVCLQVGQVGSLELLLSEIREEVDFLLIGRVGAVVFQDLLQVLLENEVSFLLFFGTRVLLVEGLLELQEIGLENVLRNRVNQAIVSEILIRLGALCIDTHE